MKIIWKGELCEVIDLGGMDGYRLYCEGISGTREEHLLTHLGVEYLIQSRTNNQFDGALILDFNSEDLERVLNYFGVRNMATRDEERAKNIARKQARRDAVKAGKVKTNDGKDLDHKKPLSKGGSNKPSNTVAKSVSKNRSEGGKIGGKKGSTAAKKKAGAEGGKTSSRKGVPNK